MLLFIVVLRATAILARSSSSSSSAYAMSVVSYPTQPALSFTAKSSAWQFAYNPAYLPGADGVPAGLMVRVQNGSALPPGQCGEPASGSFVVFTPFTPTNSGEVSSDALNEGNGPLLLPLGRQIIFGPSNTSWEQTAEDPRIVMVSGQSPGSGQRHSSNTWFMTYTANGNATKAPYNRHQGIATSTNPLEPTSWTRQCGPGFVHSFSLSLFFLFFHQHHHHRHRHYPPF
jgi:hypothetical protein